MSDLSFPRTALAFSGTAVTARRGGYQLWLVPVTGGEAVKVLDLGEKNNVLACWLDDDRIGFACDHDGRDKLGVLTLSTGAVDWRAEEPDLFPHSVLAGAGDDFICIHHQASHTRAALVGPTGIRPLPNLSGRRSLLPHAALPGGGWLAEAYDADAPTTLSPSPPMAAAARSSARPPNPRVGTPLRRTSAGPPRTGCRFRAGFTDPKAPPKA